MSNQIKFYVQEILKKHNIFSPPILIEDIVKSHNIDIAYHNFEDEIAGFLYRGKNDATIIINDSQSKERQNFTLAHEFGHFYLNHSGELFVDKVFFRNKKSKQGINRFEIEANKFAAELLMPEQMVIDSIKKNNFNIEDEGTLEKLANKFQVSKQAFLIRLNNLGLVSI